MNYIDKVPFLSSKQKRWLRENDIFSSFVLFLSSMFEYDGMPESINTSFIEFYNILSPLGCSGVYKKGEKYILGYCMEGGLLDEYMIPLKYNINTLSTDLKQGAINGVNCAVCWNNSLHRNDLVLLGRFTEKFNLLDTCETALIKYARPLPIVECEDSRIEQKIKETYKNGENGDIFTYSTKCLTKIGADTNPGLIIQQLGDYEAVDKLQYLSTYYNDLLRRFYQQFGISFNNSYKQAQQSIEEITSDTIASWIIPNDRLNERQKFIDTLNKTFGLNASVRFSDAWIKGYQRYMQDLGGDGNEEMVDNGNSEENA